MAPLFLLAAGIALCDSGPRFTCVVDGDTFWLEGEKIRIADINAPETHGAGCPAEQVRGDRAALRLVSLLNGGPYQLEMPGRAMDRYGRALRVVTRHGRSLGDTLIAEGLAEPWRGKRSDWCILLAARESQR
jgi:micrococcal nuclease